MAINESRVKQGTLTFGGQGGGVTPATAFACQATKITVTPALSDDGSEVESLCGDTLPAGKKVAWSLKGTSIQDFDDPEGFLSYCFENQLTTVTFEWAPNITAAPTWSGECLIVPLEEGGDVNVRLTTDWEFPISGEPMRTPFAGAGTTRTRKTPAETAAA